MRNKGASHKTSHKKNSCSFHNLSNCKEGKMINSMDQVHNNSSTSVALHRFRSQIIYFSIIVSVRDNLLKIIGLARLSQPNSAATSPDPPTLWDDAIITQRQQQKLLWKFQQATWLPFLTYSLINMKNKCRVKCKWDDANFVYNMQHYFVHTCRNIWSHDSIQPINPNQLAVTPL
jgi:hypothetical protein